MSRLSAQDWIAAATEQTARAGAESVRVERLAKALKVSKGSFYWHFKERRALLDAMLAYWEQAGTDAIIAQVQERSTQPDAQLEKLVQIIFRSSAMELAFEIQVRAWAAADPSVRDIVRGVDKKRVLYVVRLLKAAGRRLPRARAELLYSALLGDMLQQTYGRAPIDATQLRIIRELVLDDESLRN